MSDKLSSVLARYGQIKQKSEQYEHVQRAKEAKKQVASGASEKQAEQDQPEDNSDQEPQEPEVEQQQGLNPLPQPEKVYEKRTHARLQWLVEPEHIDQDQKKSFGELGVRDSLCSRLVELGYESAFAVQTAVIPAVLEAQRSKSPLPPVDILVNSFTGSGKTLAYCVPIVEMLLDRHVRKPRALILVPTRPLLTQVVKTLEDLTKGTKLHTLSLRSDRSLAKEKELLRDFEPDILVATPGRLSDHLASGNILASVQFIVIDEADRLLGQSFQDWSKALAKATPATNFPVDMQQTWSRPPQRLIFSATLTRDPGKLAALQIRDIPRAPKIFVVGESEREFTIPAGLHEHLLRIKTLGDKPLALVDELIKRSSSKRTIVFVRSNEAAARLARLVHHIFRTVYSQDVAVERCSGELAVADRKRTLREFAEEKISILVCTDLIARGIDVKGVDCVVNYDLPLGAREYVHRVGRTARAGSEGSAWTLCVSSAERKHFWTLQNDISREGEISVSEAQIEPDSRYEEALASLESEVLGK